MSGSSVFTFLDFNILTAPLVRPLADAPFSMLLASPAIWYLHYPDIPCRVYCLLPDLIAFCIPVHIDNYHENADIYHRNLYVTPNNNALYGYRRDQIETQIVEKVGL